MVVVQAALERLVTDIGKTGETVASQMTGQLEETMARAAAGQERMNEQMREFIIEIRRLLEEQQTQSRAALDTSINNVLNQVGLAMTRLADDRSSATLAEQARQESFKAQTESLYSGISTEMAELLQKTGQAMTHSESSILVSMQRSMDTMDAVQSSLERLVSQLGSAGESATNRMGSAVEEALMQAAAGQELMREQMRDFIVELRAAMIEQQSASSSAVSDTVSGVLQQMAVAMDKLATDRQAAENAEALRQELLRTTMVEQQNVSSTAISDTVSSVLQQMGSAMEKLATDRQASESAEAQRQELLKTTIVEQQSVSTAAISESVSSVLQQMGTAMEKLAADRKAAEVAEAQRHNELRTKTGELYGGLASEVTALLQKTSEAVTKTESNITKLQEVSTRAIGEMSDGARTMKLAAEQFTTAGNSVSTVIEKSRGVSDSLAATANVLQSSATAVKQAFDQYDKTRDTVERYVIELSTLIDTTKREAGVNKELVSTMEAIVGQLEGVEKQTAAYVLQMNEVLRKTFEYFGNSMKTQTEKSIGQTDTHLAGSVQRLGGFLQELEILMTRLAKLNKGAA
jgi:DNA-binding CsgD family transcriptional regulator